MVLSVPIVLTSVSDYRLILDERGVRVRRTAHLVLL